MLPAPAAGATRLSIRNIGCPRCLRVVQRELEKSGLVVDHVAPGAANVRMADGSPVDEPAVAARIPYSNSLLAQNAGRNLNGRPAEESPNDNAAMAPGSELKVPLIAKKASFGFTQS